MNKRTCFDILGVPGDATLEEAKQSYRRLVRRWHPDQYVSDPEKHRTAHEKLKEINVAYREVAAELKRSASGQNAGSEKNIKAESDEPDVHSSKKRPSIFRRMAAVFRHRYQDLGNLSGKESENPVQQNGHGFNPGGEFTSEFQRILAKTVRNQTGRFPGAKKKTAEGRRKTGPAGESGRSAYMPQRRTRGDRVEKIRPVRRVGKV